MLGGKENEYFIKEKDKYFQELCEADSSCREGGSELLDALFDEGFKIAIAKGQTKEVMEAIQVGIERETDEDGATVTFPF